MKMLDEIKQNQLSEFLSSIISKVQPQITPSNSDIENEIQQLQITIAEQQAKIGKLKKDLEKKNHDFDILEERFNLKRSNYKQAKVQINASQQDLTNQLQEKELLIQSLKNDLDNAKIHLGQEVQKLKEELDIANNKVVQNQSNQQTLDRYKKKLEEMADMQFRQKELEKTNSQLQNVIKQQQDQLSKLQEVECGLDFFKNQFDQEKEKLAQCEAKFQDKEQQFKQAELKIKELTEEIYLMSSRLGENYRRISDTPENTSGIFEAKDIGLDIQSELEEQLQKLQQENNHLNEKYRKEMTNDQVSNLLNEKAILEEKLFKEQQSSKQLAMMNDDLKFEVEKLKREININKQDITTMLTKLDQNEVIIVELQKKNQQIIEESDQLKKEHIKSLQDIQQIIKKKEEINAEYIKVKEEYINVQQSLQEKEKQLQVCASNLAKLESQAKILQNNEDQLKKQNEELSQNKHIEGSKIQILTLEGEKRELEFTKQIDNLNAQLKEAEDQKAKLQQEKANYQINLEHQIEETKKQMKKHYTEKQKVFKNTIGQQQLDLEYQRMVNKELKEKFEKENKLLCSLLCNIGQKIIKQQ